MNLQTPLKTAALAFLLNAVAVFMGDATAAAAPVVQQLPARPPSTVLASNTQATLTPVQQTNASSALPTNIFSGQLNFTNGAFDLSATVFPVPAGKRLVIEFVSAGVLLEPGQRLLTVTINGLQVIPNFNGNRFDGLPIFAVSQPLRDVLVAGQTLVVAAGRDSNSGVGTMFVNVIGQLEDVP